MVTRKKKTQIKKPLPRKQLPGDFVPASVKLDTSSAQADIELNKHYTRTFGTSSGKLVLAHMVSQTLEMPVLSISEGNAGVHKGFSREGQNAFVREMIKRIEKGK